MSEDVISEGYYHAIQVKTPRGPSRYRVDLKPFDLEEAKRAAAEKAWDECALTVFLDEFEPYVAENPYRGV